MSQSCPNLPAKMSAAFHLPVSHRVREHKPKIRDAYAYSILVPDRSVPRNPRLAYLMAIGRAQRSATGFDRLRSPQFGNLDLRSGLGSHMTTWVMIGILALVLIGMVISLRKDHARKNPWESGFLAGAAIGWLLSTIIVILYEGFP